MKDKKRTVKENLTVRTVKKVLDEFIKAGWLMKFESEGKIFYQEVKFKFEVK